MKKLILFISIITAGIYFVACDSDINMDQKSDVSELDTITVNDKAKDTIGIELIASDKYLILSDKEERYLYYAAKDAMIAINPVLLPEGDNPALPHKDSLSSPSLRNKAFVRAARLANVEDGNYFFGYTTSCAINDTSSLVFGEKRVDEKTINDFSGDFMVKQSQNGMYVYDNVFRYAPYGVRFLYDTNPTVGSNGRDTIIAKVQSGLIIGAYDKEADTITWDHYPRAFEAMNDSNKSNSRFYQMIPPSVTYSSKFGFLMFMGSQLDAATIKPGYIFKIDPSNGTVTEAVANWAPKYLKKYTTDDESKVKTVETESIPLFSNIVAYSVETDDLDPELPKGSIIVIGLQKEKVIQTCYRYKEGDKLEDIKFETAFITNIEGTMTKHSPANIIINPFNKRIEMVHATPYRMELYSIDAAGLVYDSIKVGNVINPLYQSGIRRAWEKECVLLDRDISIRGNGLYPMGSIINPERMVFSTYMNATENVEQGNPNLQPGVQKIIFSCGNEYPARVGVFEMTRTLDTERLSIWVNRKRSFIENQSY